MSFLNIIHVMDEQTFEHCITDDDGIYRGLMATVNDLRADLYESEQPVLDGERIVLHTLDNTLTEYLVVAHIHDVSGRSHLFLYDAIHSSCGRIVNKILDEPYTGPTWKNTIDLRHYDSITQACEYVAKAAYAHLCWGTNGRVYMVNGDFLTPTSSLASDLDDMLRT